MKAIDRCFVHHGLQTVWSVLGFFLVFFCDFCNCGDDCREKKKKETTDDHSSNNWPSSDVVHERTNHSSDDDDCDTGQDCYFLWREQIVARHRKVAQCVSFPSLGERVDCFVSERTDKFCSLLGCWIIGVIDDEGSEMVGREIIDELFFGDRESLRDVSCSKITRWSRIDEQRIRKFVSTHTISVKNVRYRETGIHDNKKKVN